MLYEILLFVSIIYLILIVTFAVAVSKAHYSFDRSLRPRVSIIIAARNEEENIRPCLESITKLTYPKPLLEVIVIDDRSTDGTHSIVSEFVAKHSYVKMLVADQEQGHLRGKTNAITKGIEASGGEVLLFTDADCTVPQHWVEEVVKYYDNPDVGIVAGFTSLRSRGWFESMQALDWFSLFSVAAAAIRMKRPVTAIGNNLSVRRVAYDAVGGYRKIPFNVTEDYALFHAVTSQTLFKPKFPLDETTLVESNPCRTSGELYRQKKRWFTGGRSMSLKSMLIFLAAYVLNCLLLVFPFLGDLRLLLIPVSLKLAADLALLASALTRFRRWGLLRYLFQYELYYMFYVLIFPLIVLPGRTVVWKDRELHEQERT